MKLLHILIVVTGGRPAQRLQFYTGIGCYAAARLRLPHCHADTGRTGARLRAGYAGRGDASSHRTARPATATKGLGDGPQSMQLPVTVPGIGLPEVARQASPAAWFKMVTQGNLDRFMPPFVGALNDQQRWDVVSYVLTLHTTAAQIAEGKDTVRGQLPGLCGQIQRSGPHGRPFRRRPGQPHQERRGRRARICKGLYGRTSPCGGRLLANPDVRIRVSGWLRLPPAHRAG